MVHCPHSAPVVRGTSLACLLALCAVLSPLDLGGNSGIRLVRAEDAKGEDAEEHKDADEGKTEEDEDGDDEMEVDEPAEPLSPEQLRGLHGRIDKDGNGRASMAEVMGFATTMMKQASKQDVEMLLGEVDSNHDGKLSLEEYMKEVKHVEEEGEEDDDDIKQIHQERQKVEASKFEAADSDGDKVLDANEFPGLFFPETNEKVLSVEVQETMKQRDSDKDGKLTQSEFFEVPDKEVDDKDKETFAKLDKNGDGKLDALEIKSWESGQFQTEESIQELFKVADKDKDGHVSVDELIQAREKIADLEAHEHLSAWADANEL